MNAGLLAAMVSNYKLLPQSDALASPNAALILRDGILSHQLPLGLRFSHDAWRGLTFRISDPAPVTPGLQLRRNRGVRCIRFVRPCRSHSQKPLTTMAEEF